VSHLSHLVPLLRNKKAATNSHHAVSHLSPCLRGKRAGARGPAGATGGAWTFTRHSLAVPA
jgi:hypothetical protein